MKVEIRVWVKDEATGEYSQDTITKVDHFKTPHVVGHGIPIERCAYEGSVLIVHLADYPTRIDTDPNFSIIHLLNKGCAEWHPLGYTLLKSDEGKGDILWANNRIEVTK